MSFDMISYVLGIISTIAVSAIYVGIVESFERRRQWNQVAYDSLTIRNPSEEFWGRQLQKNQEEMTHPATLDEKESELLSITWPKRSST